MKRAFTQFDFQLSLKLFLLLLKGDYQRARDFFSNNNLTADQFFHFIKKNYLQTFVYANFPQAVLATILPQLLPQMESFFAVRQQRQESLLNELKNIRQAFINANQSVMLLKGPYLALRFFGGLHQRGFSDLDLLIQRRDLHSAETVLQANGYRRKSRVLISRELTANYTHAFDYVKAETTIDLHWLLASHPSYQLDYQQLWQEKQQYLMAGDEYAVLSDEYEIVFNLLSLMRDIERGAARLKPFIDLYFVLKNLPHFDWQQFFLRRRQERTVKVSAYTLVLFLELFNCRDQFPQLTEILAQEFSQVKITTDEAIALFLAGPGAARNKAWAVGIYQCSRLEAGLWWLVSLPFRLVVYRQGQFTRKIRRLKDSLSATATKKITGLNIV